MSTYVAGFDGHTCCNCGLPAVGHLHSYGLDDPEPRLYCLDAVLPDPPQAPSTQEGAALARDLLALVERNRWWLTPAVLGVAHCRACGSMEGAPHNPACLYLVLVEQIGRLS